jgi:hypothetical protein
MPDAAPLLLKLATLPRNQIGPFLILGVDKDASKETIEAAWAQRLIAARKSQTAVPLEDINWAREIITDPERRLRADSNSMSVETSAGTLRQLAERFKQNSTACQPIDEEPRLGDYQPSVPEVSLDEIRAQIQVPRIPREMPAVPTLLKDAAAVPTDPWAFSLAKTEPVPDNRT